MNGNENKEGTSNPAPGHSALSVFDKTFDALVNYSVEEKWKNCVHTGFPDLDNLICGMEKGSLVLVAATGGMGKTHFLLPIYRNISVDQNVPCSFFSLKHSGEELMMRFFSMQFSIPYLDLVKGKIEEKEFPAILNGRAMFGRFGGQIVDEGADSLEQLEVLIRAQAVERNVRVVFINGLEQISSGINPMTMKGSYEISRRLKSLAGELGLVIILSVEIPMTKNSRFEMPGVWHLSVRSRIEEFADLILLLYRPEYFHIDYDEDGRSIKTYAQAIVGKNVNGTQGKVQLGYDIRYGRYFSVERANPEDPGNFGGYED